VRVARAGSLRDDRGPAGQLDGAPQTDGPSDLGVRDAECVLGHPATWPFERTTAAWKEKFGDWARMNGCALRTCHGGERIPPIQPLIPMFDQTLDENNGVKREQAIDELWAKILPGGESAPLIHRHKKIDQGGEGIDPTYLMDQLTRVREIVETTKVCTSTSS
jgi:hypothetical protein